MADLAQRLTAAIHESGKTQTQIAKEAHTRKETVSRLANGQERNPSRELLTNLARATGTTVGFLLGETIDVSHNDLKELERTLDWLEGKRPKIDARAEPNAEVMSSPARLRADKVAEGKRSRFDEEAHHVLRARGDSMINAGIIDGDTLYASTPPRSVPVGRVIAVRLNDAVYVKRLVTEHGQRFLISENPRYTPIEIESDDRFEVIGVVVGRAGNVT